MTRRQQEKRPIVYQPVDRRAFPFTIQTHCEETGELLWEYTVTGPGPVQVPAFGPRSVSVTITDPDGDTLKRTSTGVETFKRAGDPA